MEKDKILQTTVRIRDEKMQLFLADKIRYLKRKGAKGVSLQSIIEGLIAKWMQEDEKNR